MPPDARLGGAPRLQAMREPEVRLDLKPRHVLQQDRPATRRDRLLRAARGGGAAALVHLGFAALFVFLLSFRDGTPPRLVETPIEVVVEPSPVRAGGGKGADASKPDAPGGDGGKPAEAPKRPETDRLRQALATPVAPDPAPPAPPRVQPPPAPPQPKAPPAPSPKPPAAAETGNGNGPALVAPPPEPTRAAAKDREDKPANAVPEKDEADAARHEAKPAEAPPVLTTGSDAATFAVPPPAPPTPKPEDKPAPPIPAKEPSATDKLAAALAVDTTAMPTSFRSVLAGNGAQVNAMYKGLVFGRFNRHPEIGEQARRQHLKGQVVVAFTIDDAGQIAEIGVASSSGNAALDALGVELIRAAAPFPPPPADAQRSFTPALAFGQ